MQFVQSRLPVLIMQTGSLFMTKKAEKLGFLVMTGKGFIFGTPYILSMSGKMKCFVWKKKKNVEYSRIVLQCSQSAVTLENKIKCCYHLHYSKLLARNQWLSVKVIFGSQLLFCLFVFCSFFVFLFQICLWLVTL